MMVNRAKRAGLGKVLAKAKKRAKNHKAKPDSDRHTTVDANNPDWARLNLRSVTAQSTLDDFLETAELAGTQFIAEKQSVNIAKQGTNNIIETIGISKNELSQSKDAQELKASLLKTALCVPRRPKWNSTTTPEQLDEMEKASFLEWRRNLAKLQEFGDVLITPFEKNLELWRQLWRVIERSDIVVQIVDCRNPLLYLCEDLVKYVSESGSQKHNAILLNKADFLTLDQRKAWAKYFQQRQIRAIFFSALHEAAKSTDSARNKNAQDSENENNSFDLDSDLNSEINLLQKKQHKSLSVESLEDENSRPKTRSSSSFSSYDCLSEDLQTLRIEASDGNAKINLPNNDKIKADDYDEEQELERLIKVYNKFELLDLWKEMGRELLKQRQSKEIENLDSAECLQKIKQSELASLTLGLVGYPNVGKSSTINALLSAKRVAVSATPGKTKHFQTFIIDQDMILCDCPGLVFPNTVVSKSDMVINGILPIDQIKDHFSPVRLVTSKIPGQVFEDIYGLAFNHNYDQNSRYIDADDLLNSYGFMRGYMTARGLPDVSRAARKVLKDYINGKLLYCHAPPGIKQDDYHKFACEYIDPYNDDDGNEAGQHLNALQITDRQKRLMSQATGKLHNSQDFDAAYMRSMQPTGVHIKGLPGIGNMTMPLGTIAELKKEKREKKHKKKEKLRRVYRHLDV